MANIADTIKKQTDRILRQQRINGTRAVIIEGNPAGDPVVVDPAAAMTALTTHKTSSDHDGRYYTEDEVDALLAGVSGDYYEPLTNGDPASPELIFYNGDVVMGKVV